MRQNDMILEEYKLATLILVDLLALIRDARDVYTHTGRTDDILSAVDEYMSVARGALKAAQGDVPPVHVVE